MNLQIFDRWYMAVVRRLHLVIPFAAFFPLLCQIIEQGVGGETAAAMEEKLLPAFFLQLFLILPAGFLYLAEKKLRSLGLYLLCVIACVSASWLCSGWLLGRVLGIPYAGAGAVLSVIFMVLFALDALQMRFNDNERIRAKKLQDMSWTGDDYLLPRPWMQILVIFLLLYLVSLFSHSKGLGDVALAGAVLYFFLVFPYRFLKNRSDYLEKMIHISSVPSVRIRRLTGIFLAAVLIFCALFAGLAAASASGRIFLTLPRFRGIPNPDPVSGFQQEAQMEQFMNLQNLIGTEGREPPVWLQLFFRVLENVLTVAGLVFISVLLVRMLQKAVRLFRIRDTENGDEIESLLQEERVSIRIRTGFGGSAGEREKNRNRRRYRRTILRYRKEAPGIQETPSEMEKLAGLPDTEEMRNLHQEYELARYGRNEEGL